MYYHVAKWFALKLVNCLIQRTMAGLEIKINNCGWEPSIFRSINYNTSLFLPVNDYRSHKHYQSRIPKSLESRDIS